MSQKKSAASAGLRRVVFAGALAVSALGATAASAGNFDFAPAPQVDLNRIYRVERVTGEMGACQYGLKEGSVGVTLCYGPGEGGGAQTPGDYRLVTSRHEREGGVFRINDRTGEMSICYVFNEKVVCTPQAR
ncbi:hypothetical protein GCM10019059_28810 [Camelimonas fluminis]|uniref:Uncharacterized protein n=1 Tax=Camelimonas fluminis TaxID=1576911 RepID=A0ABV7UFV5_9HYPH|nr:hypothetical protein [Camelimonas fluminis]GHE67262.1 hypothetical protein GCM10019059_28810 [Camelimonas fluminis]